jgi:predicted Rossmann fold nucleotide-binding protein DprA/Smf involved in DNA uptake
MLGATEQVVAKRLLKGPAVLDVLVADTELPPAVVSSAVTILLMRGWVQSVGPAYTTAGALAR